MASAQLHVVTGKGGVGKTALSAALALHLARGGRRVLAVELGEPAGLCHLLGVRPPAHGAPVTAGTRLSVTYVDGAMALAEYLQRHVPFAGRMAAVFDHPLYRAFVSAGPGVRELMSLGKVRDELLGLATGTPAWDAIVVDAGASGQALQWLGMPAATVRTFPRGLAHREAKRVVRTLGDPNTTAVHVVAWPETIPLAEAGELIGRLRALGLPLGWLVVNGCQPQAPDGTEALIAHLAAADGANDRAVAKVASRAFAWLLLQERGIAALGERVGMTARRLPRLDVATLDRAALERLADALVEQVAPAAGAAWA